METSRRVTGSPDISLDDVFHHYIDTCKLRLERKFAKTRSRLSIRLHFFSSEAVNMGNRLLGDLITT